VTDRKLTAVELFAGGGGLAVGLERAGFRAVAAIELERNAAATFKANHPGVQVFRQDVREISGSALLELGGGSIDVLAACPPCQGFSSLTSKYRRDDPRNMLVSEVGRLAEEISPTAVMVENVPGLASKGGPLFSGLVSRLEAAGYICNWSVLQVADYGVPQVRRRLVLLAGKGFKIEMPLPTHSRTSADDKAPWRTVREAIGHMNEPLLFVEAAKMGGAHLFDWHVVRQLSQENKERLIQTKVGASGIETPDHLRPPCHRGGYSGFSNVYGRMSWDHPSPTITAGCTTLSKGRFGHPEQLRTISLREAALLQTFPCDYHFEADAFERACEIVGNALPCDFAAAVANKVHDAILSDNQISCATSALADSIN
jgi:DNA (cytosine-5)-methyltransferase 1